MTYNPSKGNLVSADETGNSTKVLLSSGSSFTGNWEIIEGYSTVGITISGSVTTSGILIIQTSTDGGVTISDSKSFPVSDTTSFAPVIWSVIESHVRVIYQNDSISQSGYFHIQTKYSNGQDQGDLESRLRSLYEGDDYVSEEEAVLNTSIKSDEIVVNTRLSEKSLNGIIEQLEDIKNLLKLILS